MFNIILQRLNKLGILDEIVIIGSWAAFLYKYYFSDSAYSFIPRTTDLDLLIPIPYRAKRQIDLSKELEDLNYIIQFSGNKGYIKLGHPELSLEFMVPEIGRGSDKPYPLQKLGINAQPVRYTDLLLKNLIKINHNGITVTIPHPALFVLQKLLILSKRKVESKKLKDIESIRTVLKEILASEKDKNYLKESFNSIPETWGKKIIKQLQNLQLINVIIFLQQ